MGEHVDGADLFTREQARRAGLTDRQLDRRLASGRLVAARRGVLYRPTDQASDSRVGEGPTADGSARQVPIEVMAALLASPGRDLVVSHATAARLLGLPRPLAGWPKPEFTAVSGPTRCRSGVSVKVACLDTSQVIDHVGICITSPARTVADCPRTLPSRDALAIADAALHRGLVSANAVIDILAEQARWPGVNLARQVLALADPRRESPLESWSAWAFAHTGVPAPQWQVEIRSEGGRLLGRADCWWSEWSARPMAARSMHWPQPSRAATPQRSSTCSKQSAGASNASAMSAPT